MTVIWFSKELRNPLLREVTRSGHTVVVTTSVPVTRQVASQHPNAAITIDHDVRQSAAQSIQFIVIDKTGPTPGIGWKDQLSHIIWGHADTLEKAWEALKNLPLRCASGSHESAAQAGTHLAAQRHRSDADPAQAMVPQSNSGGTDSGVSGVDGIKLLPRGKHSVTNRV